MGRQWYQGKIVQYDAGDYPLLTVANENGNGNSDGSENVYKHATCPLDLAPIVQSELTDGPMRTDGVARKDGTNHFNCHRCDTKSEASRFKCKIIDGRAASTSAELDALHSAYWLQDGKPSRRGVVGARPNSEVDCHTTVNNFRFRTSNKHKLTEAGHSKCECRCTPHPTGCFRKNWRFAGDFRGGGDPSFRQGSQKYIEGNIYDDISDKEECSNLCS